MLARASAIMSLMEVILGMTPFHHAGPMFGRPRLDEEHFH